METKLLFNNSKGNQLVGILNKKNSKDIVILCHGFSSNKNTKAHLAIIKKLSEISYFRFDFYGHGESEGEIGRITVSEGVDDILCTVNYIKKLGYKRIGLVGASFSGLCAVIAASKTKDVQFLILRAPVSDWEEAKRKSLSEKYIKDWEKNGSAEYVNPFNNQKFKIDVIQLYDMRKNIAYNVADKIQIPTLIIHGTEDKNVAFEQSLRLFKILQCEKELVKISGADHVFSDPKDFEQMVGAVVDFIEDKFHGM